MPVLFGLQSLNLGVSQVERKGKGENNGPEKTVNVPVEWAEALNAFGWIGVKVAFIPTTNVGCNKTTAATPPPTSLHPALPPLSSNPKHHISTCHTPTQPIPPATLISVSVCQGVCHSPPPHPSSPHLLCQIWLSNTRGVGMAPGWYGRLCPYRSATRHAHTAPEKHTDKSQRGASGYNIKGFFHLNAVTWMRLIWVLVCPCVYTLVCVCSFVCVRLCSYNPAQTLGNYIYQKPRGCDLFRSTQPV